MAEALVGGAFLSAFLQVLFDRMASTKVLSFMRGSKPNEQLLKNLKITLLSVNAVLDDAEEKQITNSAVKNWLDELKDAVYQAEDLVDEIATEATKFMLEAEFGSRTSRAVQNLSSISLGAFHREIETKLQDTLDSLTYIVNQKGVLGLREGFGMKSSPRLPTTSLVDESGVYGRDDDKEAIVKSLISDDAKGSRIGVVTIVGMGGIGKTTLAQLVYNDARVRGWFELKLWVCVSEDFDLLKVTKTILGAITLQACDINDLNLLQLKLIESLAGKRFLIVLDDVWNENLMKWELLQRPLKSGAPGSRIIVTTRNESVASIMRCTIPTHHLKQLSEEDCWLLFARHAFDVNTATHPNVEVMGRAIVKKCKGLPLAAKTLGGLLRLKLNPEEWEELLKSDVWDLSDEASDILPALRLSYHYLPSHLKRCFAYCSIFPKDYEFEREQIVMLWMAEDFLEQPKGYKSMEDIGNEYFNELISRSLFQPSRSERPCFVMHDLVHDLAQYVSREFCFTMEDGGMRGVSEKCRHFSYMKGRYDGYKKFEDLYKAQHLRTFLPLTLYQRNGYFANEVLHDLLPTQSCLRVLSLSHYSNITELPDSIGNLKHLRYLNLSHTGIKSLPDSVTTLCNLQTLLLLNCRSLIKLPEDMMKLINLHHLDIRKTMLKEMPLQIGRLKSLQTLSTFIVGKHSRPGISELRELVHLRGSLAILELQNVVHADDAGQANLKENKYLVDLEMQGSADTSNSQRDREVLDKLQPHTNLKRLTLKNYGGTRFPNWLGDPSFSNMVYLYLSNCKYCLVLPPLGMLPSLKFLYVIAIDVVEVLGPEFYGTAGLPVTPFRSLEFLDFRDMLELREWCSSGTGGGDFPALKQLYIQNCPKLNGKLPDHLPSLNKLVVSGCQQLMATVPRAPALCEVRFISCNKLLLAEEDLNSQSSVSAPEISNVISLPRPQLKEFPPGLRKLTISGCDSLDCIPDRAICGNTFLEELTIFDCSSLESLSRGAFPTSIRALRIQKCRKLELQMHHPYAGLEILSIKYSCDSLRSLPLNVFPKLISLNIWRCRNLESLSVSEDSNQKLECLQSLQIRSCPGFMLFQGLPAPNLTRMLVADCKKFKLLPEKMYDSLSSLHDLQIAGCPQFVSFPEGGLPSNVNSLSITGCKRFIPLVDFGFQRLPFLTKLTIEGCNDIESFPEELLLPRSLTCLRIFSLSKLRFLNSKGLGILSSLERLEIDNCPMLQYMPTEGLPNSLCMLIVKRCPLLNQRCQKKEGEDWSSISHIPFIEMDRQFI